MTIIDVSHYQPGPIEPGKYVKATDLRELLMGWERELSGSVETGVGDEMREERLSLHCEPEVREVTTWRGMDIEKMDLDELRQALKSTASDFR